MKKRLMYFLSSQVFILVLMLIFYKNFQLVSYINMSFFVGGTITFIGLMTYVVAGGFFDFFTESTRKVFTPRHMKKEAQAMRLPSEVFSFPYKPIIALGLSDLFCMCIALFFYYSF
ncbi:protein of unknown function [Psychrobacillus sp. OK028]|uniref:DUF3899 domain-containing protein n=1 Tax=Psychrobacillus sp. OK028 TaxID=1884359 RepID=UPI0008803DAF|nr:DUF3899 domain-containing protein [Psychrobacillus sp. OK028]SDM45657.1 protein of unknown function [Psychrobacillus sp. OK028]